MEIVGTAVQNLIQWYLIIYEMYWDPFGRMDRLLPRCSQTRKGAGTRYTSRDFIVRFPHFASFDYRQAQVQNLKFTVTKTPRFRRQRSVMEGPVLGEVNALCSAQDRAAAEELLHLLLLHVPWQAPHPNHEVLLGHCGNLGGC